MAVAHLSVNGAESANQLRQQDRFFGGNTTNISEHGTTYGS